MVESDAVPIYVPVIAAAIASAIRGATSFGDGITFQAVWAIASAVGMLPSLSPHLIRKGVLFASVMQLMTMPIVLYQSRSVIPHILGFVVPMIVFGALFVGVGAQLLLVGNVAFLRIFSGVFFGLFAVTQLTLAVRTGLKRKHAHQAPETAAPPSIDDLAAAATHPAAPHDTQAHASGLADANHEEVDVRPLPTAVNQAPHDDVAAPPSESATAAVPEVHDSPEHAHHDAMEHADMAPLTRPADGPRHRCHAWLLHWLPRLSMKVAPERMLLMLCCAAMAGGMLAGMLGAGGPPFMAVYAILELDKDVLRGFSAVPAVFMLIRLFIYVFGDGSVFHWDEWPVYVSIWIAAAAGASGGTYCRRYIDSPTLVKILYVIIFASSALMLGATQDVRVAGSYTIFCFLWTLAAVLLWQYPGLASRLCMLPGERAQEATVAAGERHETPAAAATKA